MYNLFQIIKNSNFYYIFVYFILLILYLGVFLISYDFDLNISILWIIYGGVLIIFFMFSLMWLDLLKLNYSGFNLKNYYYIFIIIILVSLIILFYYKGNNNFIKLNYNFINFYNEIILNIFNELELLGWGVIYYTSIIFLIIAYFLLINCLIIITVINNIKKIKSNILNSLYIYMRRDKKSIFVGALKNQKFFIQEYENLYQRNSIIKNFKITIFFHQVKGINRRV